MDKRSEFKKLLEDIIEKISAELDIVREIYIEENININPITDTYNKLVNIKGGDIFNNIQKIVNLYKDKIIELNKTININLNELEIMIDEIMITKRVLINDKIKNILIKILNEILYEENQIFMI